MRYRRIFVLLVVPVLLGSVVSLTLDVGSSAGSATSSHGRAGTVNLDAFEAPDAGSGGVGQVPRWCADPGRVITRSLIDVPEGPTHSGPRITASVLTMSSDTGPIEERIPPDGWRPATATSAELAFFGIPARPHTGDALRQWDYEWVDHYSGMDIATPCRALSYASANGQLHNWSGAVATPGGVTAAVGTTSWQSSFSCTNQPDSFTHWVGIGGFNGSGDLLQNGFWTDDSHSIPFYEAISGSLDTHVVPVSPPIQFGDSVRILTQWLGHDTVEFVWHDLTTGKAGGIRTDKFFIGGPSYSASMFYDSSSGEAIDERGRINGSPSYLRDFGADYWDSVDLAVNQGTRTPIDAFSGSEMLDMVESGHLYADASGISSGDFTDNWDAC